MGNKYGIMLKVTLTCRLSKDFEKNSAEGASSKGFTVKVRTIDHIGVLKEKIYEEVKKTNNDFLEIEDYDELKLWKVEIDNNNDEEFSNLVLKNATKLLGSVGEYWDDEERRPKEGCTHVIIDSPRLIERREKDGVIDELCEEVERLRLQIQEPADEYSYKISDGWTDKKKVLRDLCFAKIIRVNDGYG